MKLLLEKWNSFLNEEKSFTDTEKIALVIFGEAGGESFLGKQAVLHVAINRSKHDGKSLLYIMEKSGQFSILKKSCFEIIVSEQDVLVMHTARAPHGSK